MQGKFPNTDRIPRQSRSERPPFFVPVPVQTLFSICGTWQKSRCLWGNTCEKSVNNKIKCSVRPTTNKTQTWKCTITNKTLKTTPVLFTDPLRQGDIQALIDTHIPRRESRLLYFSFLLLRGITQEANGELKRA